MVLKKLIVALTIFVVASPAIACTSQLNDDEYPELRNADYPVKYVIHATIDARTSTRLGGTLRFSDIYDVKNIEKSGICSLIIGGPIPMTHAENPGTWTSVGYRVETCGYVRESQYVWDDVTPEAKPASTDRAEPRLASDCLNRCEEGECR